MQPDTEALFLGGRMASSVRGELEVGLVTQDGGLQRGVPGLSVWKALVLGKGRGYTGSGMAWSS